MPCYSLVFSECVHFAIWEWSIAFLDLADCFRLELVLCDCFVLVIATFLLLFEILTDWFIEFSNSADLIIRASSLADWLLVRIVLGGMLVMVVALIDWLTCLLNLTDIELVEASTDRCFEIIAIWSTWLVHVVLINVWFLEGVSLAILIILKLPDRF